MRSPKKYIKLISHYHYGVVVKKGIFMWRLIRGNVLEFLRMFKDSHVWLQITLRNQMLGESKFPL